MFGDKNYENMSTEEIENNIDEKIKSLMGDEYQEKKEEYRWDDGNLIQYKDKVAERLKKDDPYWAPEAYEKIASRDLPLINPIFEKNIVEYINGEPLTEIKVGSGEYGVNAILSLRRNAGGVLEALKDLSIYSVNEQEGLSRFTSRYTIK